MCMVHTKTRLIAVCAGAASHCRHELALATVIVDQQALAIVVDGEAGSSDAALPWKLRISSPSSKLQSKRQHSKQQRMGALS